jgi:hypothetical protein
MYWYVCLYIFVIQNVELDVLVMHLQSYKEK